MQAMKMSRLPADDAGATSLKLVCLVWDTETQRLQNSLAPTPIVMLRIVVRITGYQRLWLARIA